MRKRSMGNRSGSMAEPIAPSSDPMAAVDRETSSARKRIPDVVPVRWLDRLFGAALDLPLFGGELAVMPGLRKSAVALADGLRDADTVRAPAAAAA